jgi:glutamyl-tRNA reductase
MPDALQSLFVLGSSHHEAPLEIRERFALSPEQTLQLQQELYDLPSIRECLVVSTCNRLEIYGLAEEEPDIESIIREHLCKQRSVDRTLFDAHSFWHTNLNVLQHALEVSSGLESQMVGETEILRQMKNAYQKAREAKCIGSVLNRLFEKSFQAAKSARTQTAITRGQISIGNVAVDLASRIFGKLSSSRVLLLGSGEVGAKTAQSLKSRGVDDISVSSRTYENAHALAHALGGAAIEFADFSQQLEHFDIVICSTAAPLPILTLQNLAPAMKRRPERPCFLIDLAMPRDIDPAVEKLENVYLYNLDDLSAIANENLELRRAEIDQARSILKTHAWNLWLQLRRRELMPKKVALTR